MGKLLLIAFYLISIVFVSRVFAQRHRSFLLTTEGNELELPTTKIPWIVDANTTIWCPVEREDDVENFKRMSETFFPIKYCLFQKKKKIDGLCAKDVKPLLLEKRDYRTNEVESCGTSPAHHLVHQFGFYTCGSEDIIDQLRDENNQKTPEKFIKSRFFPIYELCIDVEEKTTLWTKHKIMTPEIFKEFYENGYQTNYDQQISTDALSFTKEYFEEMKQKYANQEIKEKLPRMTETFIVPKEHVAIPMWRKTVHHYINVAPFWSKTSNLMTAVNNGIKTLASELHSNHRSLTIYTKIITIPDTNQNVTDFNKNYWVKLLYEEKTQSAAWIVLLNTPFKTTKIIGCEKMANCQTMRHWNGVRGEVVELFDLRYAYCCYPSTREIQSIFNINLNVVNDLELNPKDDTELREAFV